MKSVVLLSAGLDSTVNLYEAASSGEVALALTVDYGQKAAKKEIESAQIISSTLNIPHKILELKFFKDFGKSSLIVANEEIPMYANVQIDNMEVSRKTAESVWVPNRNGILLNVAAGFAESMNADTVIPGFNKEEAATFPDNSEDFIAAMNNSLLFSTNNKVKVHCFTSSLTKTELVKRGIQLGVKWNQIWPCYFAKSKWCGVCESCQRSKRAFKANDLNLDEYYT